MRAIPEGAMGKGSVQVLLLGTNVEIAYLRQFMDSRGCHGSFAASGKAVLLEPQAFELVLRTAPREQPDPLVLELIRSNCAAS